MNMTFSNTSLWTQTFRVISIYLSYIWILLCFNKAPIQAKKICVSVSWPTLILCADPNTFYYKSGLPTVIGLTSTVFTKQSYKNKCMQRYQKKPHHLSKHLKDFSGAVWQHGSYPVFFPQLNYQCNSFSGHWCVINLNIL